MIPENRVATHPGTILREEFINPLGITQTQLADHLNVPVQRINEIINGKRGVSPETAWLLAEALNTSAAFWLNLQAMYDLSASRPKKHIEPLKAI